jgi:hypothetical protein
MKRRILALAILTATLGPTIYWQARGLTPTPLVVAPLTDSDKLHAPSIEEIKAGIRQRRDHYRNLEFAYDVRYQIRPSREATFGSASETTHWTRDTKDVLRILDSNVPGSSRVLRSWERYSESFRGRALDRMVGFDGLHFREFKRRPRWNEARIAPWEAPYLHNNNLFDQFLFLRLTGIPQYWDPDEKTLAQFAAPWEITGLATQNGVRLYVLGVTAPNGTQITAYVSGPPDFVVYRWVASDNKRVYRWFEVSETREFEGLIYPAAGKHRMYACGELPDHSYEFKVTSVRRLTDAARADWFPKWPPDTVIADQVRNKTIVVDAQGNAGVLSMGNVYRGSRPPELTSSGTWINSGEPLTLASLRGKVVWLEFSFLR